MLQNVLLVSNVNDRVFTFFLKEGLAKKKGPLALSWLPDVLFIFLDSFLLIFVQDGIIMYYKLILYCYSFHVYEHLNRCGVFQGKSMTI